MWCILLCLLLSHMLVALVTLSLCFALCSQPAARRLPRVAMPRRHSPAGCCPTVARRVSVVGLARRRCLFCQTLEAVMFGEADAAEEVSARCSADEFSTTKLRRALLRNMTSVLDDGKLSCPPRPFRSHACNGITFAASRRMWRCVRAASGRSAGSLSPRKKQAGRTTGQQAGPAGGQLVAKEEAYIF